MYKCCHKSARKCFCSLRASAVGCKDSLITVEVKVAVQPRVGCQGLPGTLMDCTLPVSISSSCLAPLLIKCSMSCRSRGSKFLALLRLGVS